eukprot:GSMAST32.ASY1.ANO1.2731.1 assembled CDS
MTPIVQVKAGLMDPAYFLGRRELVQWVNAEINTNYQKVEETASGAAVVQLLDKCFPKKVPMHKVNWAAKADYEYIQNYKIIQKLFNKFKVEKHVDVNKLIRGKYQDNLEWLQWMKAFFEANYNEAEEYDAVARRAKGKGGSKVKTNSAPGAAARKNKTASLKENNVTSHNTSLTQSNAELKLMVDGLEKERDFYFAKLREVEVMLQDPDDESQVKKLLDKCFALLYASEEGSEDSTTEQETGQVVA